MSAGIVGGTSPPQTTGPGTARTSAPGRRWRHRVGIAAVLAVATFLIWSACYAARYQPVVFGGGFDRPAGPHLISRQVNTTGGLTGQSYLPPQPSAHGTFMVSLGNTGPFPVTIESVSLLPPGLPGSAIHFGRPFRIDGTPTYILEDLRLAQRAPSPRPLRGAVLDPGEYIDVRIPFQTARCWLPGSYTEIGSVWVTTRTLLWTHDVAIGWTEPSDLSQGAILSEEGYASVGAATGLVCPR